MPKKTTVAVSGYFNPLHVGHLRMIQEAKKLGDHLVVIVNNDNQVKLKGSVPFISQEDRCEIVGAIKGVDEVFLSIDQDPSVCESLKKIKPHIYAKGGDRNRGNIPETPVCDELGIKIIDGVGGGKIRASSEMIKKARNFKV